MTDEQWHVMRDGIAEGPVELSELQRRAQSGALGRADMVWRDGMPDWVQAGTIKGLFRTPPPPPMIPPAGFPAANGVHPPGVDPVANRRMVAQLRDDAADTRLLVAELMRVAVRLNPVNLQIHSFLEPINQITESTPRHDRARLVQEAMKEVDLTNAAPTLDEALDGITKVAPEVVTTTTSNLLSVWPEAKRLVRHRWLDDPAREGENVRQQLRRALQAHRDDLVVIQKHYRQLQEFHPRYDAILTRGGFWDYLVGFAAGFFGGGLGLIGAEVWDDWRGKSDSDFAESFGAAVEQFSEAALSFTRKTEEAVEPVVAAFLADLTEFADGTILALEGVVDSKDVTAIYRKLHYPDPADRPDENGKQFLEIVLSNLREQQLPARSEANIREMLGLA